MYILAELQSIQNHLFMLCKFLSNYIRSSHSEIFLGKGVLKICSKFTGKHHCRSVISIKLLCYFIEVVLRHGCSPVNLLHIFRTPCLKNTSGWLLLLYLCAKLNFKGWKSRFVNDFQFCLRFQVFSP